MTARPPPAARHVREPAQSVSEALTRLESRQGGLESASTNQGIMRPTKAGVARTSVFEVPRFVLLWVEIPSRRRRMIPAYSTHSKIVASLARTSSHDRPGDAFRHPAVARGEIKQRGLVAPDNARRFRSRAHEIYGKTPLFVGNCHRS